MRSTESRLGRTPVLIIAGLLWLATAALGLAAIYYLHALAIFFYDTFIGKEYSSAVLIGQVSAVVGAIIWLVAIIGSGEFHLKHAGEQKSWRIFAWMLGIEVLIVVAGRLATGAL